MTRPTLDADTLRNQLLEHQTFVGRLARSLVRDEGVADDLAQDAWVVALQRAPHEPVDLRSWLAGVLRRLAFNRRRGDVRRKLREELAARPEAVESTDRLAEQQRVVGAVLLLEGSLRDVVVQTYFDGLAPKEIADRLGIPSATVRTRLHRARGRLREDLDELHGGDRRSWRTALMPFAAPSVGESWKTLQAEPLSSGWTSMHVGALVSSAVAVAVIGTLTAISLGGREEGLASEPPSVESVQLSVMAPAPKIAPAVMVAANRAAVKDEGSRTERRALETPRDAYWAAVREARSKAIRFRESETSATMDLETWQRAAQVSVASLSVADESLLEVVQLIEVLSGVRIAPSQGALATAEDLNVELDFDLRHPHDLGTILDIVLGFMGPEFMWYTSYDGIRIISREETLEDLVTFEHSIADLLVDPATYFPEESVPQPIFREPTDLDELIVFLQETVSPGWWEVLGVSMEPGEGTLRVTHLPSVHQEIQEALDHWREFRCPLPEDGFPGQAVMMGVSDRDLELIEMLLERPVGSMLAGVTQEVAVLELLRFLAQEQSFDLIVAPGAQERMNPMSFVLDAEGRERTISTSHLDGDPKGIARAEVQWNVIDNCVLFRTAFENVHAYVRANFDVRDLIDADDLEDQVREAHTPWWDQDPRTICRLNRNGVLEIVNSPLVVAQVREFLDGLRRER